MIFKNKKLSLNFKPMKELLENLQGFIQSNIDLARLEVQEKIESFAKKLLKYAVFGILVFFSILFLLLSIGFLLGNLFNNNFYGFSLLAILLGIAATIIYLFKISNDQNVNN